ncbi:MAG: geranylgeranyl reductase family protein [Candidatus Hodarchaeales archaeon]|jgi:digeranylgeranylglycerophospholipid reductase
MPKKADIVVIGGGPAGSQAAHEAVKRDANVLVLDRKDSVGIPVQCGEAIGKSRAEISNIWIPERSILNELTGMTIFAPSGDFVDYTKGEVNGYIIDRRIFDKEHLIRAAEAGADVKVGCHVMDVKVENDKVLITGKRRGESFEVECKGVIGADGVHSIVARKTGLVKMTLAKDLDTGIACDMVGVSAQKIDFMEFHIGREICPRGYIWIFPKGENLSNVGIGIGPGFGEPGVTAHDYLERWMKKNPIGSKICKNAKIVEYRVGAIPLGGLVKKPIGDRVVLTGDAAGMVSPITGGGLGYGSRGGQFAGIRMAEAVNENDFSTEFLQKYIDDWKVDFEKTFSTHMTMRRILEQITDEQLNTLAEFFTGKDVIGMVDGKIQKVKLTGQILKKDPSLVKLLKPLLA